MFQTYLTLISDDFNNQKVKSIVYNIKSDLFRSEIIFHVSPLNQFDLVLIFSIFFVCTHPKIKWQKIIIQKKHHRIRTLIRIKRDLNKQDLLNLNLIIFEDNIPKNKNHQENSRPTKNRMFSFNLLINQQYREKRQIISMIQLQSFFDTDYIFYLMENSKLPSELLLRAEQGGKWQRESNPSQFFYFTPDNVTPDYNLLLNQGYHTCQSLNNQISIKVKELWGPSDLNLQQFQPQKMLNLINSISGIKQISNIYIEKQKSGPTDINSQFFGPLLASQKGDISAIIDYLISLLAMGPNDIRADNVQIWSIFYLFSGYIDNLCTLYYVFIQQQSSRTSAGKKLRLIGNSWKYTKLPLLEQK